jgi:hypothetical protein
VLSVANMTGPTVDSFLPSTSNTEIQLKIRESIGLSVLDQEALLQQIATQTGQSITVLRKVLKEEVQAHILQLTKTEDPTDSRWYFEFETFWVARYGSIIKYIVDWQEWVMWDTYVFKPVSEESIEKIIITWLDSHNQIRNLNKINLAIRCLKATWNTELKDYDADPNIINIGNGFLNLKTKVLIPHIVDNRPTHLSLRHAPAKFVALPFLESFKTPFWDKMRETYPVALARIEWFFRAVIFRRMDDELSLFIVGPRGSGKGTTLNMFELMFGDSICSSGFNDIGEGFGLAPLTGHLLNMDKEMNIEKLFPKTVRNFKTITGQDGNVQVNPKGKAQYKYNFIPFFFVNASNQLGKLPGTDIDAFLRRVFYAELNVRFKRDNSFKNSLKDEVDIIFSELVYIGYAPFFTKNQDLQPFIDDAKEFWDRWSNPIRIAVEFLFERSKGIDQLPCEIVWDAIGEALVDLNYGGFSENSIKTNATACLKRLGIKKCHSMDKYYYRPIQFKDPKKAEYYKDEDENVPKRIEKIDKNKLDEFTIMQHLDESE